MSSRKGMSKAKKTNSDKQPTLSQCRKFLSNKYKENYDRVDNLSEEKKLYSVHLKGDDNWYTAGSTLECMKGHISELFLKTPLTNEIVLEFSSILQSMEGLLNSLDNPIE